MTPRSLVGVNEPKPAANPGSVVPSANVVIELSGGVGTGLTVRRSSLWKQETPVAFPARNVSTLAQSSAAKALPAHVINASTPAARSNIAFLMQHLPFCFELNRRLATARMGRREVVTAAFARI